MEDLVIIGTGCAGYTAAIYSARANLNPLILSGTQPGGQLTTTTEVENFPGFPEGIMGPELMMRMQQQAEKFGARTEWASVESVTRNPDGSFALHAGAATIHARAVIVATGAAPRHLGLPNEKALIGRGLTSCATCDGAFYRDVPVCVIGGGDSACEEANFLTRFASTVYLIHRRDELRASKIMAERVLANPKVVPVWDSEVSAYLTDEAGEMRAVRLRNLKTGEESELELKCVFVAIGHVPNSGFLGNLVDRDENGYILQNPGRTTTRTACRRGCCGPLLPSSDYSRWSGLRGGPRGGAVLDRCRGVAHRGACRLAPHGQAWEALEIPPARAFSRHFVAFAELTS
jgi:thioredoxin reductase (NADPH)